MVQSIRNTFRILFRYRLSSKLISINNNQEAAFNYELHLCAKKVIKVEIIVCYRFQLRELLGGKLYII